MFETDLAHLPKSGTPIRVYHFTTGKYGLQNIKNRRLKIARISELNDLFEMVSPDLSDRRKRQAVLDTKKEIDKSRGILCFSKTWRDPVQWGHYAEKHQGICLAFDVPQELLFQVKYVRSRTHWPAVVDEQFVAGLFTTKFSHWAYEDECRLWAALNTEENGLYFCQFSELLVLRQVLVGASSPITRQEVADALGDLVDTVETFKVRAAFRSFRIVRNKKEALWR